MRSVLPPPLLSLQLSVSSCKCREICDQRGGSHSRLLGAVRAVDVHAARTGRDAHTQTHSHSQTHTHTNTQTLTLAGRPTTHHPPTPKLNRLHAIFSCLGTFGYLVLSQLVVLSFFLHSMLHHLHQCHHLMSLTYAVHFNGTFLRLFPHFRVDPVAPMFVALAVSTRPPAYPPTCLPACRESAQETSSASSPFASTSTSTTPNRGLRHLPNSSSSSNNSNDNRRLEQTHLGVGHGLPVPQPAEVLLVVRKGESVSVAAAE